MRKDNLDPGFEQYRRERNRRRAQNGPLRPIDGKSAIHELEMVEAKEMKDRQLSREVHEFFECATKQAATIVQRVAENAKTESVERVTVEMEEFLLDAFSRMNNFVLQILNSRRGPVAEQQIETHMQNLIGPMLDEFRNAGTAILNDKHVGQDPFATDPAELVKELQPAAQDDQAVVMPLPSLADNPPVNFTSHTVDVESHPLAMKIRDDQADAEAADDEPAPELPPSPPPVQRATAATARPDAGNAGNSQAERFKEALRNLVRQGMMTKDEARAAWQTKRQTFGPK